MSVELLNGYVLLAQRADWSSPPRWSLAWDTEVAGTLRGNEGRSALREMPRPTLQYTARPLNTQDQAQLVGALIVGMATGQVCAPLFGRASWLAADAAVGATALQIEPSPWAWAVGDYLVLYPDQGGHRALQITAIDATGTRLTVAALDVAVSSAGPVYPVFSGRPEIESIEQTSGEISTVPIRIVGDEFQISPDVPTACVVSNALALANFDFAVIRYQWGPGDGVDLDTRTALVSPQVGRDVGWSRALEVASDNGTVYLLWGQDNQQANGLEAVLVAFPAIVAAYPTAATITIRLRANWYAARYDGNFNLQFATYLGGTMHGPNNYDFINVGGTAVQVINTPRNVTSNVPADVDGQDVGTLVYTPATKSAVILPAATGGAAATNAASAQAVQSKATKDPA